MSFFDEDDEPRTRVRPRRATPSGGAAAPPDRRTALIRQGVLLAVGLLIVLVLVLLINGCRKSARESALKDYNREVASLVAASDTEVAQPFFDLMREPTQGAGDLRTQVNGYKNQAAQQYEQAKRIDTPGEMDARPALVPDRDGDAPRRAAADRRPRRHGAQLRRRGRRQGDQGDRRRDAARSCPPT